MEGLIEMIATLYNSQICHHMLNVLLCFFSRLADPDFCSISSRFFLDE